jgi:hypothetical protein
MLLDIRVRLFELICEMEGDDRQTRLIILCEALAFLFSDAPLTYFECMGLNPRTTM